MEDYTAPITEMETPVFDAPEMTNDILNTAPTIPEVTKEATSEFGWRQGLVLGGLAVGGICTLYTGYKVFVDKNGLVRGKVIPWIKGKFAKNQVPVQDVQQEEEFIPEEAYVDEA